MEKLFKLPINKIMNDENSDYVSYHYTYYSGEGTKYNPGKFAIGISHIKNINEHYLLVYINDNIKDTHKEYKIKKINQTSLNKLQEQIDTYLTKKKVEEVFVNSWQLLIDKSNKDMIEKKVVAIEDDEITLNDGSKFKMLDWQIGKTIEELNEIHEKKCLDVIEGYKQYIKREDN